MTAEDAPLAPCGAPGVTGAPETPPTPPQPPVRPATAPANPGRSRRGAPTDTERALADRIARHATALRDGADDQGLSITEAVALAAIQIGDPS
jgi:hypothetical protein